LLSDDRPIPISFLWLYAKAYTSSDIADPGLHSSGLYAKAYTSSDIADARFYSPRLYAKAYTSFDIADAGFHSSGFTLKHASSDIAARRKRYSFAIHFS